MILTTERLILREIEISDLDEVCVYASDEDVLKYIQWGPNDRQMTQKYIETCMEERKLEPRIDHDLVIVNRETGCIIGGCAFIHYLEKDEASIGYLLRAYCQRHGYATEASREIIRYCFESLGVHRLYIKCDAENYGSYRVMEKCGLRREGYFVKARPRKFGLHEWRNELLYAILKEEWEELCPIRIK